MGAERSGSAAAAARRQALLVEADAGRAERDGRRAGLDRDLLHLDALGEVQQISVQPGSATVTLGATGISLDEQSLATRGSCS